jgi:predicted CXXCH cytochrome family protein
VEQAPAEGLESSSDRTRFMKRANGTLAHRARALFTAATLLGTLVLAFVPNSAASVLALTPDPSALVDSPVPGPTPTPDPLAATPSPTPDPAAATPTPTPTPDPAATPTPDPAAATPTPTPDPAATPTPTPTPDPAAATPTPTPTPALDPVATVQLTLSTDAPADGRHRIDPGARLHLMVGLADPLTLPASRLSVSIPTGWSIIDAGGGTYDDIEGRIAWDLDPVGGGVPLERLVDVRAPSTSPVDGGLDFESTFASRLEVSGVVVAGPSTTILVAPQVEVEHSTLGLVPDLTLVPTYMPEDSALLDVQRFDMIRVRFQVRNEDDRAMTIRPRLEYRRSSETAYVAVAAHDNVEGIAFYVGPEWVSSGLVGGGTVLGPDAEAIGVEAIRSRDTSDPTEVRIQGDHSMGPNPAASLSLPARSYTEVEFSIRATTDAQYLAAYDFRITDDGTPLVGAVVATLGMGAEPPLLQSPVQFSGAPVGPAPDAAATPAYPLLLPGRVPLGLVPLGPARDAAGSAAGATLYALVAAALTGQSTLTASGTPVVGTHGPYGMAADQCAFCHRTHAAQGPSSLPVGAPPQSALCFQCHDAAGTGAVTRVEAQYTDTLVPANSPSTGAYYRHDALAAGSTHTLAGDNEFGGVSNRHDECVDCHSPHVASGSTSAQTATGWTVPGQLTNVAAVSVVNGIAKSPPTYALLDGSATKITLEYQLCLKCHSGWTTLPVRDPLHPSWWAEDKGIEFNPANGSVHPIEAPGRNTTTAMANSLAGTSPYKLWSFTPNSTIRCVNCHGDYRKFSTTAPPAAGSDLAPHASQYRGTLMQNYRDRDLKPATEPYQSGDFALCYLCHAEAPFADGSGNTRTDTNFRYHGMHVTGIRNQGSTNGSVDTSGAGRGDAICSECHFRIHSTAFAGDFRASPPQSGTDAGLVNFAPNVTAYTGVVDWTRTGTRTGTCALTCHGKGHEDESY